MYTFQEDILNIIIESFSENSLIQNFELIQPQILLWNTSDTRIRFPNTLNIQWKHNKTWFQDEIFLTAFKLQK